MTLLYTTYELQRASLNMAGAWASVGAEMLNNPILPIGKTGLAPILSSALEVFAHAAAPRGKPEFDIETVEAGGKVHAVEESIVLHRPFGNLLRFARADLPAEAP